MTQEEQGEYSVLLFQKWNFGKVDTNTYVKVVKSQILYLQKKSKSHTTNSIIEVVFNIGSHKKQCLALNHALSHLKLVN